MNKVSRLAVCSLLVCTASLMASYNTSLSFDGINDFVDCGLSPSLQIQNEYTIEAWLWAAPIADNAMYSIFSSQNDATTSGIGFFIDGRTNPDGQTAIKRHIHIQTGNGSWHSANSNPPVPENQWVHIAVTRKAGEPVKIYYNGQPTAVQSTSWNGAVTYNAHWFIGKQSDVSRFFNGLIDRVSIWNRALTESEIQALVFTPPQPSSANLMGLWDFEQTPGETVADLSPNANNGTVSGAAFVTTDFGSSIQPDLSIRSYDRTEYIGTAVYDSSQSLSYFVPANSSAQFEIKLTNRRIAPDAFSLVATGPDTSWTIQYVDAQDNFDLTSEFVAGTTTPAIASGGSLKAYLTVTPSASVPVGSSKTITITAASLSDPAKTDSFTITVTKSAGKIPAAKLYTINADFAKGSLLGLDCNTIPNQLQVGSFTSVLPYIWVPNSNESTVSKVDTRTGRELARYYTGPSSNGSPSRTTVDLEGSCYLANRQTGTVIKIALLEAGLASDRNANGRIDTSSDLNGDGIITSNEMLPWGQDECVMFEISVVPGFEGTFRPGQFTSYANDNLNPGPRGLAVDSKNNIWIGTFGSRKFYYINGSDGRILRTIDVSSVNHTSYGAVIDSHGTLWSSGNDKNHILRLNTSDYTFTTIPLSHLVYGLAVDQSDHLFASGWENSKLSRINVLTGEVEWTKPSAYGTKGLAVTSDGDVWVACYHGNSILRYSNDGQLKNTISSAGSQPSGVAIDSSDKVWFVDYGDGYVKRVDPATNSIELSKNLPGTSHYGYSDMTGIVARNTTTRLGTWTFIHDSLSAQTVWGIINYTSSEPNGTSIRVKARSSSDQLSWSPWEDVVKNRSLMVTPPARYLQVQAVLQAQLSKPSPVLYDLGVGFIPFGDLNRDGLTDFVDFALFAASWLDSGLWY